ncbi:MAG: phosphopentomutase, partial [Lentisphaerae bacterium]|nr:phosphopentomutase [Lentisphaerota bacterium]
MRMFLLVLDSVGIGAAPDAGDYGDAGACTLGHLAAAVGGLQLPCMQRMGLGNAAALLGPSSRIPGVDPATSPSGSWGVMRERSAGKDTTTGHWELAGLELKKGFATFPAKGPAFPGPLLDEFSRATGRGIIGNRAASGTAIIEELGDEHMRTGRWIIYTSADSVFQIAAHEDVVPLPELYGGCGKARELCNPLRVGRVIARPFTGRPGAFQRTENRRDFSYPLPERTVLDHISEAGIRVTTIGKLDDIFAGRGISDSMHAESNAGAQKAMTARAADPEAGFVFANFIDFDMLYGHRRDAVGYAQCLRETDAYLSGFVELLRPDDVLVICADHGNDPTFKGTDHTREYVPLLVYPRQQNGCLGIRNGFYDVAQS